MFDLPPNDPYLPWGDRLSAVPMWSDGCRCPARPETTAVPAPSVKAWPAIPINWTAGPGVLPFDLFGRSITRQKAITVPGATQVPFSMYGCSGRNCRQQTGSHNGNEA